MAFSGEENHITGVIEITRGTTAKLEMCKFMPNNPIQQDVNTNKDTGLKQLRNYGKPPKFNYGYIPRTWCSSQIAGDDDAIDLVDLSQKQLKKTLSVSDYLVLGILGLVD